MEGIPVETMVLVNSGHTSGSGPVKTLQEQSDRRLSLSRWMKNADTVESPERFARLKLPGSIRSD